MFAVLCILLVVAPAVLVASFPLHAAWSFRRQRRRDGAGRHVALVSVIMPLAGDDDDIERAVDCLLAQKTNFPVELIFCAETAADSGMSRVQRRLAAQAARHSRLVVTGPAADGELGKMHNLRAGVNVARGDVLVFVDSDTVLDHPSFLERLVDDVDRDGVGLVTCFPAYRNATQIPAALVASMINHDLPGYFAMLDAWKGLRVANGACMAMTRICLDSIGGLEPLRAQLLMDARLAQKVSAAGFRVQLHEYPVAVDKRRMRWIDAWHQVMRWQTAMWRVLPRQQYFAFLWMRCGGLAAVVLVALAGPGSRRLAWLCLFVYCASRLVSAAIMNARYLRDPAFIRHLWLLPATEMSNGITALAAMFQTNITWRGKRYRVRRDGTVETIGDARREPCVRTVAR